MGKALKRHLDLPDRYVLLSRYSPLCVAAGALVALLASASSPAASELEYDPRTWSFDGSRQTLIPSSEQQPEGASERWTPMPSQIVPFGEFRPRGSIVVDTSQRRLYLVLGSGRALRYVVGVGKEGFSWAGQSVISDKQHWPDWRPPKEMIAREASMGRLLPAKVEGGPNNPLGARALYIGDTLYRIHGTNQPWTVGSANSSGCIRMTNEDVIDLYERVAVGALVIVRR